MEGPWCSLQARGAIDGNRFVRIDTSAGPKTGEEDLQGDISAGAGYSAALDISFSPDPNGLAVMDCPPSNKPLNQYVINGGGQGSFVIPTAVTYGGSDTTFYNKLLNGLDWTIARAPSPMLSRVPNGSSTVGSSTDVFPQHISSDTPDAVQGLAFENVLPLNNGAFGTSSINHIFNGQVLATSPIAIFYQANAYTHPVGAAKWCQATAIGTEGHLRPDYLIADSSPIPNWFHYYSQAWTPPCPVAFSPDYQGSDPNASHFDRNHPDHVHVNYDANGTLVRNIYEPRYDSLLGAMRMTEVGNKTFYGIDAYASSVTHEYGHMTAYNARQTMNTADNDGNGYPDGDNDGDGLPNALEVEVGLHPNRQDTTQTNKPGLDEEVYCDIKQRNAQGPREADWANNGLNWGRTPGQCPADRSPVFP